jgi:hypothetical protein
VQQILDHQEWCVGVAGCTPIDACQNASDIVVNNTVITAEVQIGVTGQSLFSLNRDDLAQLICPIVKSGLDNALVNNASYPDAVYPQWALEVECDADLIETAFVCNVDKVCVTYQFTFQFVCNDENRELYAGLASAALRADHLGPMLLMAIGRYGLGASFWATASSWVSFSAFVKFKILRIRDLFVFLLYLSFLSS